MKLYLAGALNGWGLIEEVGALVLPVACSMNQLLPELLTILKSVQSQKSTNVGSSATLTL